MQWTTLLVLGLILLAFGCASRNNVASGPPPLMIARQGSFAVGGTVVTAPGEYHPSSRAPDGQTYHGDHAYVFYQIPASARQYPLVLWHGLGQFSKTWETTPDGREGYQTIFLRRGYGVYVLDQPRRGRAGRTTTALAITPKPDEQYLFNFFRLGIWPDLYPGSQFSKNSEALNQYFRQMTPDTGPIDTNVNSAAVAALFDRIGPAILVSHSHAGGMGWATVMKTANIRAVVCYEPGLGFIFPEGEVPPPIKSEFGDMQAVGVPKADFMQLTKIPIIIYYGDNIPDQPSTDLGKDQWRVRLAMARKWVQTVNEYGGDATLVHLPDLGIHGNTHFPFSDLNNVQIADLLSEWLHKKGLDHLTNGDLDHH